MAVDVNSNKYTFGFATVLVIVVATLLAIASESLKPMQNANIDNEKRQNILSSVGVTVEAAEAADVYNELITETYVLGADGNIIEQPKTEAFKIDVLGQYKDKAKADADKEFPLFVCQKDGKRSYIIPMVGTGLWGPIWGYMAIASDGMTVEGVSFDHKSETPGLGAEINQAWFQAPFVGKTIFDEQGNFAPIKAVKGGAAEGDMHGVDAISGGTITSNGLSLMIENTLKIYTNFLKGVQQPVVEELTVAVADSLAVDSLMMDSLNVEVTQ